VAAREVAAGIHGRARQLRRVSTACGVAAVGAGEPPRTFGAQGSRGPRAAGSGDECQRRVGLRQSAWVSRTRMATAERGYQHAEQRRRADAGRLLGRVGGA
jgi:hypothetical protein